MYKNFINSYRKYLLSTHNYNFMEYKFIYYLPEHKMYYISDDFQHLNYQYQLEVLAVSDQMQSNNLLDFIKNMFYFNWQEINKNQQRQCIELFNKETHQSFVKKACNVYAFLQFNYENLKNSFLILDK